MPKALKLYATEVDDMDILSAAVERLITSPGEMSFLKGSRAFLLVGSRFKWEDTITEPDTAANWHRIRSGIYIGDVLNVRTRGISQETPTEALELLNLSTQRGTDAAAEICLNFAGGGTICLDTECINVTLTDTGEAWHTEHKPVHADDAGSK